MSDKREEALEYLVRLSEKKGYVTFDDIIDSSENWNLPIQNVDWLSGSITKRSILVYDEVPSINNDPDDDDYVDFAHTDYNIIFDRTLELDKSLKFFIKSVKAICPPQWREIAQLKYQVIESNTYARSRMIEMYIRLAVKIAVQRSEAYDLDISDAIGYACIGLITAVDRYDPDNNGAFSSYAALWILQVLNREMPTRRLDVYYPAHMKDKYYTTYPLIKGRGCLECGEIRTCDKLRKMIIEKVECTNEQAEEVVNACMPFESIEVLFEKIDLYDKQEDYDDVYNNKTDIFEKQYLIADGNIMDQFSDKLLREQLDVLLDSLKPREKEIIIARYGLDGSDERTLQDVGDQLGLTRERIRQIEAKAIRKLKHPTRKRMIKDFLY